MKMTDQRVCQRACIYQIPITGRMNILLCTESSCEVMIHELMASLLFVACGSLCLWKVKRINDVS